MLKRMLLCGLGVALFSTGTRAEDPSAQPEEAFDVKAIMSKFMGGQAMEGKQEKLPDFEKVTEGMESKEGLFTLWYYPADAKDKDLEKLLCQIPAGFLGENFMLSASFSGGGFFTGFPLPERVVKWELLGRQVLLIEPETHHVVDEKKEVSDVVRRTYPDRIRAAVPLVTKTKSGDPVIDLGKLLKSDFADITWISFFESGSLGTINPTLSKWTKKKAFELNVEIGVELAVSKMSPPGSYDKKMIHFSFWKLPKTDYKPRIADDRVGYFVTANQDWSKPSTDRDIFNRYIDRWHLVKRDPSLKLCEPKKPIIFYIEKTVPVRYRRAVRDGILEWNKAFEKVGLVNAVEVRQQTDDNEWKNLDPEDMRYSFFRWIVTGAGFAMGPHRANPFTGQIYDADIIFDDSMVRYFEQSIDRMVTDEALAMKMEDPALRAFLEAHPQWQRSSRPWERFSIGQKDHTELRHAMMDRMRSEGRHYCDYAMGMRHQMALAGSFLATERSEVKEQFLYDIIKEVVMHEVGHTLGLRHNFKASSIYTLEEIKKRRGTGEPTTGSVMDYNAALFTSDGLKDGHYITPTIGPYDEWAIEYGYRANGSSTTKSDEYEATDDEGAEATAQASPGAASGTPDVKAMLENLPPGVLEQIPPEVRKMIESGQLDMKQMAQAAGHMAPQGMGAPGGGPKPSAGSAFASAPAGEAKMLEKIASRAAEPELAYASDEDATILGPDPKVWRFDVGADPIDWANDRIRLVNDRLANILEWSVKDSESWYYLRQILVRLFVEKALVLDHVGRYIGGQYYTRAHRDDPNAAPPFVMVDAETQRRALQFIEDNLFEDEYFAVSPEVLNHLAVPRWWHRGTTINFAVDFPVHDLISMLQWWNLSDRLFPNTLRRIHDAEMKVHASANGKLTVAEYLQRIQNGCWSGVCDLKRTTKVAGTDDKPFISDIRRSLQREYLGLMEPLVRTKPGYVISADIHAMVRFSLSELKDEIGKVLAAGDGKIDFASEAHLATCGSRIERMLEIELDEYEYKMH